MACSGSRDRRDCVHCAQDRAPNRAAARATAQSITWLRCRRAIIQTLSSFPRAAAQSARASLSNQFREILVDAGLVEPRGHESTGKGRSQARKMSEISFHSLRHSAVTMLKASGLSDVFAREIVGHESAAVSRQYTHLSTDDLRSAMQRLPDVTNS